MKHATSSVFIFICCTLSAFGSVFNWAESSGTELNQQNNNTNTFSHGSLNATVTVTGSGFSGGAVERLQHGYTNPAYHRDPAAGDWTYIPADSGLALHTDFTSSAEFITVTITFDKVVSGLSFTIYGLETGKPTEAYNSEAGRNLFTYHWQNAISGLQGSNGDDRVGLSPSSGNVTNSTGVTDGIYYDFTNDTYYGLNISAGPNNYHGTGGNLSVVANDDVTSISFTFLSGKYLNDSQLDKQDSFDEDPQGHQRIGIGHLSFDGFADLPTPPPTGGEVPEPSTYASILALGALGAAFVLRRRRLAKA